MYAYFLPTDCALSCYVNAHAMSYLADFDVGSRQQLAQDMALYPTNRQQNPTSVVSGASDCCFLPNLIIHLFAWLVAQPRPLASRSSRPVIISDDEDEEHNDEYVLKADSNTLSHLNVIIDRVLRSQLSP